MKVPFVDLKTQYESIKDEMNVAIQQVLGSSSFVGGPFVEKFEKEFASFCQSQNAIGVGSGTEALWLSLLALGVGPGDEVITVPNTFMATAAAISFCGAKPIFVDIDERTYNMDPNKLEGYLNKRYALCSTPSAVKLKAIIPVHLFGQTADLDPILEIARRHGLFVIEDACQAHGSEYKGKRAGSIGDAGCFSFYPGKNLGAYGEGGAIVTDNTELATKIRILRDHGQSKKYHHDIIGWNARMDGIQGAVLNVKLKHLPAWNNARRQHAQRYNELLSEVESILTPKGTEYSRHVYHVYAIRAQKRDELIPFLAQRDITCGIHYPIPIHLQKAYHSLGSPKGSFPVSERCALEFVSLPMFPELTDEQIEYVGTEIKHFYKMQ